MSITWSLQVQTGNGRQGAPRFSWPDHLAGVSSGHTFPSGEGLGLGTWSLSFHKKQNGFPWAWLLYLSDSPGHTVSHMQTRAVRQDQSRVWVEVGVPSSLGPLPGRGCRAGDLPLHPLAQLLSDHPICKQTLELQLSSSGHQECPLLQLTEKPCVHIHLKYE